MHLITVSFKNLFRNLRRTFAILMTLAVGTSALFCFDGFIKGVLHQYAEGTIHAHYGHGQLHEKGYREAFYESPKEHWIANFEEFKAELKSQDDVLHVFPRINFAALLSHEKKQASGIGQGIDGKEEAAFFYGLNIEEGVPLGDSQNGMILGNGLAKALNAHIGDSIKIAAEGNEIHLKVAGIFHTGSKDFDDKMFRIPLKAAQSLLKTARVETISLGLKSQESWEKIAKFAEEKFPALEAVSFDVLDAIYYQHSVNWLESQFQTVQMIILLIVLLGIFNTVSTIVLERRQEIGNLRANGESVFDIMKLLLSEGVILGILGASFDILISLFLNATLLKNGITMPPGPGLTRDFVAYFQMDLYMALPIIFMGGTAAFIATFSSGLKVAKMPIGEALRSV